MSPRKYDQVARAQAAAETRRRILEAVGARLRDAPTEQLDHVLAEPDMAARSAAYEMPLSDHRALVVDLDSL